MILLPALVFSARRPHSRNVYPWGTKYPPRRKPKMTIAIGILASDGIVVGADTQHTWATLKLSATKLVTGQNIVVTGSGDSFYIETIGKLLTKHAQVNPEDDCDQLEERFGGILEDFYERKVVPFAKFKDRPEFELIIGAERNGERRLWLTNMATLGHQDLFAVSGTGAPYVTSPLATLLDPRLTKPHKLTCAFAWKTLAYAVSLAKEHVEDCGKHTHVAVLRDGAVKAIPEANIKVIEYHLARSSEDQVLGIQYALGYEYDDESAATNVLLARIKNTRNQIKPLHDQQFNTGEPTLE